MKDPQHPPTLIDSYGRRIDYLRVSVTDRCNYRCFYCMPSEGVEEGLHKDFLSYEEMTRIIGLFARLGVSKVRFTGGEPLVRKNMVALARQVNALEGIHDLSLSTNAHLLERFAPDLYQAGVTRVNISIDSLNVETFAEITRGGDLSCVIRGIDAAIATGMGPVKLNMVVMKGINDGEIEAMLDFAAERDVQLRFIETMPIGSAGLDGSKHYYPADAILQRVKDRFGSELVSIKGCKGAGPASVYQVGTGPMQVGVITAMSRHFCEGCNRVRLTAKGDLVLCLGQEDSVSLRVPLRAGASDDELTAIVLNAIDRKPERHHFEDSEGTVPLRQMSSLGG